MRRRRECLPLRMLWGCCVWVLIAGASASGQVTPTSSKAVEPWADPGLKTTRGLVLWLDAGRINAARKAHGLAEVANEGRVDRWYDASGHGRDLAQPKKD